ncbi:MAG TPA: POTRA domain-containing protein [Acidobacteriaceae bacterium]|nr:POTRA domain-containing protein [Acidobacteriaceae bacterium]
MGSTAVPVVRNNLCPAHRALPRRFAGPFGSRSVFVLAGVLLACASPSFAQQPVNPGAPTPGSPAQQRRKTPPVPPGSVLPSYNSTRAQSQTKVQPVPTSRQLEGWAGLQVSEIRFSGVSRDDLEPLPEQLEQQPRAPLDPAKVRSSLRRLYATGLYQTVAIDGERLGNDVVLIFQGTPTIFVGRISIKGVKNTQLSNQLNYSTRLNPGTPFTGQKLNRATDLLQQTLQQSGYYEGSVVPHTWLDKTDAEMNIQFEVKQGKQARVGDVAVQGDSGMTVPTFRKRAKLKQNSKVNSDTVSRALTRLRKHYQGQHRLEANVRLASGKYQKPVNHLNYDFQADRGPVVKIVVEGAKLSDGKIRYLVPIYSEGTLDEDLLNEGSKRIRDYFQREGYFNTKITHTSSASDGVTHITYDVTLGPRDRIKSVSISGDSYFGTSLLIQRLSVQPASVFMRHGTYSQALQEADINTITALYQSNGFTNVKVTPEIRVVSTSPKTGDRELAVTYRIAEGTQQKVGEYNIVGASPAQLAEIQPRLSLQSGQPYSGSNLAGDRDAILGYFLDHGYDHAQVSLQQHPAATDPNLINIAILVTPGDQIFIRHVLISGLHYTRPSTVKPQILVSDGQPLDQSKLLETQRQLYNLTLFNQVTTAVENPAGDELRKNVLVQFDEARRWDVTYGVGFQAQTGNPATNCPNPLSLIQLGISPSSYSCNPNGRFGVSALGELDVSRINLWGRNQSVTFRSEYGSLEKQITLNYSAPNFFNHPTIDFSVGGGYINAQNVITFASSTAEADIRLTQHPNLIDTLMYQLSYRRVQVDPNTIQVSPDLIPLLSEPVRVGGPELTWIHDSRRPEPLDARAGMYNSIQVFATDNAVLSSQANFAHFDWSNSTYHALGKERNYVLARNTRFGMERVFGEAKYESIPLPERLYAGGPESLRGFPLNSAGPRDSLTGFPIGGAGVFVNQTELRLPYPQLPYFGKSLGFVLFEDMGNVFNNSSDIWSSAIRIKQPHSYTCTGAAYLTADAQKQVTRSSSTNTTGTCDFNDFSHAVGLGARYHTPIGPIRVDFSYNLNPPVYPVIIGYGSTSTSTSNSCEDSSQAPPCVGRAGHFNFFFSIGQAF